MATHVHSEPAEPRTPSTDILMQGHRKPNDVFQPLSGYEQEAGGGARKKVNTNPLYCKKTHNGFV